MEYKDTDIKVFGRLANVTVDGILADSQQIYDSTSKTFQSNLNDSFSTVSYSNPNNMCIIKSGKDLFYVDGVANIDNIGQANKRVAVLRQIGSSDKGRQVIEIYGDSTNEMIIKTRYYEN